VDLSEGWAEDSKTLFCYCHSLSAELGPYHRLTSTFHHPQTSVGSRQDNELAGLRPSRESILV